MIINIIMHEDKLHNLFIEEKRTEGNSKMKTRTRNRNEKNCWYLLMSHVLALKSSHLMVMFILSTIHIQFYFSTLFHLCPIQLSSDNTILKWFILWFLFTFCFSFSFASRSLITHDWKFRERTKKYSWAHFKCTLFRQVEDGHGCSEWPQSEWENENENEKKKKHRNEYWVDRMMMRVTDHRPSINRFLFHMRIEV